MRQDPTHASWLITLIVEIDRHQPGVCGEFFRASTERRHVIAAYLSKTPPAQPDMAEAGRFLLEADHRTILAAAYGEVPRGLRGALRRAGEIVQDRRFYRLLHRHLAAPAHGQVGKCISRLSPISFTALRIVHFLPEAVCRAKVVEVIESVQMARDVAAAIRLLIERGVDGDELAHAIREVRSEADLKKVWQTWLLKAEAPGGPVPATDFFRPISSGADLHQIARRYRNCARRYMIELLDGEAGQAFAEVRHAGEGAVVHLMRTSGKWRLEGIFGPRNARAGSALRDRTEGYLAAHGVETQQVKRREPTRWDALRRISAAHLFDFDFE